MRKLIASFVVVAVAVTANQVFAQCATCAGSAPSFSQPTTYAAPQVYSAPVQSYAAPAQSYAAPVESYPAAVSYESAPVQYGTPVASSGCSSCSGGGMVSGGIIDGGMVSGGMVEGGMMSGEMSPYSTQGLPAGAVVISDVVAGEEGSNEGTVEGTVVGDTSASEGSPTDAVEPPTPEPQEDAAVDKLPTEDTSEAAEVSDDGT